MKRLAIAFFGLLIAIAAPAQAADQRAAETFIRDLGDRAVEIFRQPDLTPEAAVPQFRQLFSASFDVPTVGRFVLGRYWNVATPAQQQEYLALFEDLVVETYARRFSGYSGESFEVLGSRPEGDNDVMVHTRIVRPEGPPVAVSWRTRERGGRPKIIDVVVEGISMLVTQRNEFAAVIQRNGGRIDALLDALRMRIATAQAQSN
jgi:phospholipid transport system substrate-binding protein